MVKASQRLDSIDALRGFDMLMIIFADRFFYYLHEAANTDFTGFLAEQFEHPDWFGFHIYDVIMPLFLFLVGVVIPFSLSSRLKSDEAGRPLLYYHIFRRFLILFLLGWIVQGNLLALDIGQFKVFSNTLQSIAVGYVVSCLAFIHLKKAHRYYLFGFCLLAYFLILQFWPVPNYGAGDLMPDRNIALYVDHMVFGRFDDGYQYTWFLSSLGFIATTLSGLFAGEMLRSKMPQIKICHGLLLMGLILLVTGGLLHLVQPFIKKIWTPSFVLVSSGVCFGLLGLFYWVIDIKQIKG